MSRTTRDILPIQLYLSSDRQIPITTSRAGCPRCSHVPRDALQRLWRKLEEGKGLDDSVPGRRHDKRAGLEDSAQTPRMGPRGQHVPGVRPRSHPPKWNPRGDQFRGNAQKCITDVEQLLIKITSNRYAVNSLLLRAGLLSWIEIQVHGTVPEGEALQWCRVLDNVLTVSDATKMESVTEGQWRKAVMRIVERILETNGMSLWRSSFFFKLTSIQVPPSVLGDSVSLISRLQAISPGDLDLLRAVDLALKSVHVLEIGLRIQDGAHVDSKDLETNLRSQPSLEGASMVLWGKAIVTLWRVVMGFDTKPLSWDGLTLRVIVWRCIAGERDVAEGEWARREAIRNLRLASDQY